jgi:formylglycine-generating enzyme required for sulfatase activity/predicted Ser/Thr protein kinase/dienelactone hydrolase
MRDSISHYRIEAEIGRGGMGVVYRAVDTRLGRAVAIKVLPTDTTGDPERQRRFLREAQSASALNHPNIVTIYEVGADAETTFIAMELVDGTPLDRLLAQGPLPVATALEYAVQIAGALAAAHARGIIHRDVKPANIVITRDGRAKVLDFGIAKLIELPPTEATITSVPTAAGVIMGTAEYMSPEQAEGRPVDARSDIFSFGAVLYEMLAGRRPFGGSTRVGVITSILRDQPAPVRSVRADAPAAIEPILQRALAKDPAARYPDAGAMRADLAAAHATVTRQDDAPWRRPIVLVPVGILLIAAASFGVWQMVQSRRARWAREVAIPEIERIQTTDRSLAALPLALEAERYAPDEVGRIRRGWTRFRLSTEPAGAQVDIKNYVDIDGQWVSLGTSPVQDVLVPFGFYRVRITKAGYVPIELSSNSAGRETIKLTPPDATPAEMVFVRGGPFSVGVTKPVQLPDFWIDQHEVTNDAFKRFVDAGGYRDAKYWKAPFQSGDRVLSFAEAVSRFRDPTGRTGPADWELGSYPEGQAQYPVGGISWFEAAAYAEFAGKSLPTIYHWFRAAGADDLFSDVLRLSNFDGKGAVKAGERRGLGPWGTVDMGGNVKEWCANAVEGANKRYILGGGWNEPSYRFRESEARDPWERQAALGTRLVKNLGPVGKASDAIADVYGDPGSLVPVGDQEFDVLKRFYTYERSPLNARVESVDDSSPYWKKETVSFDAAYGGERVPAYLFLPKDVAPPFQTIVLFPNLYARNASSSQHLDYGTFEFLIRSGRALLYPVYKGTFERGGGKPPQGGVRDMNVQWGKDFFRAVDYLATRPEIAQDKLGYYSISMGAFFAPIPLALEPRIKVAVLAAGGLRFNYPPETQPANFMPRVRIPVLTVNGRDDFSTPYEAQVRFFQLFGTPPEHKKQVTLEGGHAPNDMRALFRETLDWFDKYLGPVK